VHSLAPYIALLDVTQLFQSFSVLLLVDVMHYEVLVAFNVICKVNALLDLAMGLQQLVKGVLVDVVFVLLQEGSELSLLSLDHR